MDSYVTSTNTTPDIPQKPNVAQTDEVDQVLGKRQRVEDDGMLPNDSKEQLPIAEAIKEVVEWITNGTRIVEARPPDEVPPQEEKPVKKKTKTDKSAPGDGKTGKREHKRNGASCPYCSKR